MFGFISKERFMDSFTAELKIEALCCSLCGSVQSVRSVPVRPGPGAERAGPGVQPEARRAEGAAAAAAPRAAPGAVLQRKVPETRTHQAGTREYTQQIHARIETLISK